MDGLLRDAIARIAGPGQVVEVRALTDQFTHSGYFSDPAALVRVVEPLDADSSVHGIYITLNEVNPALLSRRANRIKMRLGKKDSTTSDADIRAAAGCRSISTRCDRVVCQARMRSTGLRWRSPKR